MVMANSNAPVVAAAGSAVTHHATTTVNATTVSPSPQQVGREFVRQYYTILHEAPEILHRFYSAGSTFVHGGIDRPGHSVEEPVVGQLEIDKKIKQLAFKDCHTKIRQVDSQSTIGSGVVVQVTGELSNNGEPMRRFMQTFVLAPQTPKKYYVHNDIFRYQDEVYQDLSDTESEETSPAPVVQVQSSQPAPTVVQQTPVTVQQQTPEVTHHHLTTSVPANAQTNTTSSATSDYHHHDADSNTALLNGHIHSASSTASSSSASSSSSILNHAAEQAVAQLQHHHHHHHEPVETKLVIEAPIAEEIITKKEEVQVHKSEPTSSEPKNNSWAKIITNKTNDVVPNQQQNVTAQTQHIQPAPVATTANTQQQPTGKPQREARQQGQKTSLQNGSLNKSAGKRNNSSGNGSISQQQPQQQQQQQSQSQQSQQQSGSNRPRGGNKEANNNNNHNKENREINSTQRDANNNKDFEDLEDKDKIRYPDNQQVFVGNLSPEISDAELTQFFSQYGKVLEVRINTNTKQQSGRRLPNYGFVVFDDKNSVEVLLGNTKSNNLTFKTDKAEYRLNVEEKRARQGRGAGGNANFGGNKPRATRSTSNGSNSNNQQQQQQAPSNKKNFDRKENIETSGGGEGRKSNSNYRRS